MQRLDDDVTLESVWLVLLGEVRGAASAAAEPLEQGVRAQLPAGEIDWILHRAGTLHRGRASFDEIKYRISATEQAPELQSSVP